MIDALIEWFALLWCRLLGRRRGDPLRTWTGVKFYPLDPRPGDVTIYDVARGLATEARYGGHTREFYSVAEHSYLVSCAVERLALSRGWSPRQALRTAIVAMLHDASEAYIGDVVRPLKYARAMRGYRRIERRVERAIWAWLDLAIEVRRTPAIVALVKEVDDRILVDEMTAMRATVAPEDLDRWTRTFGFPVDAQVQLWSPRSAERAFLARWDELVGAELRGAA